ncbi:MAG: hypothetical protein KDB03_11140 [Planctomycetales bacterium]|nr:hypothetical protein [Planctomycetales bacterium]
MNRTSTERKSPHRLNGRWFVLVLTSCMGLVLAGIVSILYAYDKIESAQDSTATAWRATTQMLLNRYQIIERSVADAVDRNQLPIEIAERFRLAKDGFDATSLPVAQIERAQQLEDLVLSRESTMGLQMEFNLESSIELERAVADLNRYVEDEKRKLNSLSGRLLRTFISVPPPRSFKLAENSDHAS